MIRKTAVTAAMTVALAIGLTTTGITSATASTSAWECSSGLPLCFYDNGDGTGEVQALPHYAGCYTVWSLKDRISSYNIVRGGFSIRLQNWTGSSWVTIEDIPANFAGRRGVQPAANDKTDRIVVGGFPC
ncbi:hypothetical protein ACFYXC_41025 [Streptomyces sp. NPDC002701]|uniref:hypothetical protein n=1 Tax=Streptomyces sp. NPDC002701 TaxID=3364661 RepID=UPI00367A6808